MSLLSSPGATEAPLAPELDTLGAVAPQVRDCLLGSWRVAIDAVGSDVFTDTRARVESLLGFAAHDLREPTSPLLEAAAALTEQFLVYVPGVGEDLLQPVRAIFGNDGLETFLQGLYVVDQTTRLRLIHSQLFGPAPQPGPAVTSPENPTSLPMALAALHASTMVLSALDAQTTEIIRLRAASYHHCRLCASLRLEVDGTSAVDESLAARIERNDLSGMREEHVLAIRYADAHMVDPKRIDPALVRALTAQFTREQLVELTLDVSQWNQQKILVALGTDDPVSDDGLTPLTFDDSGHIVHGAHGSLG